MTAISFAARTTSLFLATALPLALAACASEAPEQKPDATTAGTGGTAPVAGTGGSTSAGQSGQGGSAGTGIAGAPAGGAGATGLGGAGASSGGAPAGGAGAGAGLGGGAGGAGAPTAGAPSGGIGGAATGGIGGASSGGGPQGGSNGSGGGGAFTLTSTAHAEGAVFADKYTCALGSFTSSVSPPLAWGGAPAGTKSFALTFIDTSLSKKSPPDPLGYHWALYNIPPGTMGLKEALMAADVTALNAKQTGAFLGPCPNVGGGTRTDTYEFTLYALATETITLTGSGTSAVMNAETQLEASNLGKVKLSGTSNAKPK